MCVYKTKPTLAMEWSGAGLEPLSYFLLMSVGVSPFLCGLAFWKKKMGNPKMIQLSPEQALGANLPMGTPVHVTTFLSGHTHGLDERNHLPLNAKWMDDDFCILTARVSEYCCI